MNVGKVLRIAAREFAATALTKGFIIGALIVPALLLVFMPLIIMLVSSAKPPPVVGQLAVVDRSGEIAALLAERLEPTAMAERMKMNIARTAEQIKDTLGPMGAAAGGAMKQAEAAIDLEALGVPSISVAPLDPATTDIEAEQTRLRERIGIKVDRGQDRGLIALAVIDANAVVPSEPGGAADGDKEDDANNASPYGGFTLYTVPKLDDRTISEMRSALRWSIRDRRYAHAGVDRSDLNHLIKVDAPDTQEVTETGTRRSSMELNMFLPAIFMFLMLMGVFTGGQYLLTTTIEEKSSRVVELLLSAVSPMELMTGKVLGQMGVGMTLMLIYNALGIVALIAFERLDLISASTLVWMIVFFVLAYFMFASLMAAAGSAVNDMREAQSLMTPIMLVAMLPYFLFLPVIRDPNSVLSTVLSFTPPISPFIMMMRVASTDPPPLWQVVLSVAVAVLGVMLCVWIAAKVFRVGLLMFGKPPNLRTLIRWIRMA